MPVCVTISAAVGILQKLTKHYAVLIRGKQRFLALRARLDFWEL